MIGLEVASVVKHWNRPGNLCNVTFMNDAFGEFGLTPGADDRTRAIAHFLESGGEMGERIRSFDWTSSVLGSPDGWPMGLRTAVRIMLNTNHPVFIFWGPALTCLYNDAYARSLGPEKHPMMLGAHGREAWDEIWPIIGPQAEHVMGGHGATWHENALVPITRFGKLEDVYWTYSYGPIHEDTAPNGVGGVLVLCTETTERILAEATVRADAERWRGIFEQSPGFICVLRGENHVYEYCNAAYFDLIGRRTNLIGKRVAEALPEVVAQGFIDLLDRVYRTGESHSDVSAPLTVLGVDRLVDFVYQPLRDYGEEINGILVQGVDVTVRERARAAQRESTARLQMATAAAQLGIHEYDVQSGRISWDARVREIWGLAADIEITYELFMDAIVPEDRIATQEAVDRALDVSGSGNYDAEYRVVDRAGMQRWVRATGQTEFRDGRPMRLVGTVQDISREKVTAAELIEADRRKDIFLATLAHELRNPLAPIRNAAKILATPGIDDDQIAWVQRVVARQSAHMSSLLDDLLDVARLTQGRLELKPEVVEVRSVIDAAAETVRPQLDAKGHRLDIDIPPGGVRVHGDPVRLCQVFANLLGNAIKYMDADGRIHVSVRIDTTNAIIAVHDSGIGISEASLPNVFGMFQQSESALERAEGGLGIGLALVRALVDLHGGSVTARSEGSGRGSTFVVCLPCVNDVDELTPQVPTDAEDMTMSFKRILVADDNRDAADSLAMLLGMHGHEVRVVTDGVATLEAVEAFRPDVVLLDIGMPRLNGYDVARQLRSVAHGRSVRLIALTGWGQAEDRQKAFDAGFDAHLTKPPDVQRILEELSR